MQYKIIKTVFSDFENAVFNVIFNEFIELFLPSGSICPTIFICLSVYSVRYTVLKTAVCLSKSAIGCILNGGILQSSAKRAILCIQAFADTSFQVLFSGSFLKQIRYVNKQDLSVPNIGKLGRPPWYLISQLFFRD